MEQNLRANEFPHPKEPLSQATAFWTEVAKKPDVLVPNKQFYRTAFGNGVTLLGSDNSLSREIKSHLVQGRAIVAGVEFSEDELKWIGQYYQAINAKGMKGVCMDERLNEPSGTSGIHDDCGAAAAIGRVIGKSGIQVEDEAATLTGEHDKMHLLPGMKHHEGLTVMITLGPQPHSLDPIQYTNARENAALPFHTFIDIQKVADFAKQKGLDRGQVFTALLKWNPQIAFNIMTGDHNDYQSEATHQGIIAVMDTRGVDRAQYGDLFAIADTFFQSQKTPIKQIEIK